MRIALISPWAGTSFGTEKALETSCRLLRKEGHTVLVLTGVWRGDARPEGTQVIAGLNEQHAFASPFSVMKVRKHIMTVLEEFNPDVVHLLEAFDFRIMDAIGRRFPSVIAAHSVGMSCPASHRLTGLGTICEKRGGWKCFSHTRQLKCLSDYRGVLRQFKVVFNHYLRERVAQKQFNLVVVSEYLKRVYLGQGWAPEKVHLVPNAVNVIDGKIPSPDKEPVILFSGRFTALKGVSLMMESLARIKDRRWTLVVVGGEKDEKNQKLVEKYGLLGKVEFKGWQPEREVRKWYERATLIIQTNLAPEAFGLTVAEASAAGRPVIVTDVPALNEIVLKNKTGLIVSPDSQKIANAILELLESPELCRKLGKNGQAHMKETYHEAKHFEALIETYRAVLRKAGKEVSEEEKIRSAS